MKLFNIIVVAFIHLHFVAKIFIIAGVIVDIILLWKIYKPRRRENEKVY